MTNIEFENIDILKELEASFETEHNKNKIETINILEDIIEDTQNTDVLENVITEEPKVNKKKHSILNSFVFFGKYILTSSLIFGVLMISTNYSAYISIAKGYIFKSEMEATSQRLISSVEASNIKNKYAEEKITLLEEEEAKEKLSIKQMKKNQDKKNIDFNIEITPYENRVIIPKIGKSIPLVDIKNRNIKGESELNDIFMEELEKGIIRYPGSSKPGEDGISFIFGHSSNFPWIKGEYNDVFALLDNVEFDDEVIIYYEQRKYVYKIRKKDVITPGDVSVLKSKKNISEISLMTCWPIGTTLNRLIVTGELIEIK